MKKLFAPKECYSKLDEFLAGYSVGLVNLLEKTEYFKNNELQKTSYLVEYLNPESENCYSPATSYVDEVFETFEDCKDYCDKQNVQLKANCISACVETPEMTFGIEETSKMIDKNFISIAKDNEELKNSLKDDSSSEKQNG